MKTPVNLREVEAETHATDRMPAHSAKVNRGSRIPDGLPFSIGEYSARRASVRAAMAIRGIDLLFVTSPPNLCYLTEYQAIWYPGRLPLGVVVERDDETVTLFDWRRHEGYATTRVLCDDVVYLEYGTAPDTLAAAFSQRGWRNRKVAVEWESLTPSAATVLAVSESLREIGMTIEPADWLVDQVRLYKSPQEVSCVRKAASIADSAMLQLQRELRPGMTEIEVSALLSTLLAQHGSEVAAMSPQVNSGPTAWADSHAFPSRRRLEPGDVVAVDCCAVVDRYHANLGRTFAIGNPHPRAAEMLTHAAGSVGELQRNARLNEGPEKAIEAAQRHVRQSIAEEHVWWIGGYSIGIAMPPSWAGHTYLANDGPKRCLLHEGYVSNYENILIDKDAGFEASFIDTIVMTDSGLDVLSSVPRGLLETGT